MAKKEIRWGMIGTGNVTEKKSAPSFNKIEGSRLLAVGNRTPEKAESYAKRHGIPNWYRNPFDVISDPQVDVVYIATPPGSHVEYALKCIQAGKPVYLEKPMARTWKECRIINHAAAVEGVPVYVAYYRRSLPYFLKAKEIIDSGLLGKVLHINMRQYFPSRKEDHSLDNMPWRVIPKHSGGGYFHDMGCHSLDILFYLFGDPVEVSGRAVNMAGLYEPADTLNASLLLQRKILVTGSWSFVSPEAYLEDRVVVTGTEGKLEFSIFSFEPIALNSKKGQETFAIEQPEHIQMPLIKTIVSELNGKGVCPSTGKTAAVTSQVMDVLSGPFPEI